MGRLIHGLDARTRHGAVTESLPRGALRAIIRKDVSGRYMTMSDMELDEYNRATGRLEARAERGIFPMRTEGRQHISPELVTFDRLELREILNLYGRKVAEGEWRDYAIDFTAQEAIFSIFRRACEYPLYRILKNPRLARKQGAFSVVAATGLVLKRGHELKNVIRVLDKKLTLVSG